MGCGVGRVLWSDSRAQLLVRLPAMGRIYMQLVRRLTTSVALLTEADDKLDHEDHDERGVADMHPAHPTGLGATEGADE